MFIANSESLEKHYLLPSQLYVGKEPTEVTTILGSCISVCLWDSQRKIGGINHFMLPIWNNGLASPKFGNVAIEKLLKKMLDLGCNKNFIIAKVFGGGNINFHEQDIFNIGQRNSEFAIDFLKKMQIKVVASDCGGNYGRKILFYTHTGVVVQSYISKDTKCKVVNGY